MFWVNDATILEKSIASYLISSFIEFPRSVSSSSDINVFNFHGFNLYFPPVQSQQQVALIPFIRNKIENTAWRGLMGMYLYLIPSCELCTFLALTKQKLIFRNIKGRSISLQQYHNLKIYIRKLRLQLTPMEPWAATNKALSYCDGDTSPCPGPYPTAAYSEFHIGFSIMLSPQNVH